MKARCGGGTWGKKGGEAVRAAGKSEKKREAASASVVSQSSWGRLGTRRFRLVDEKARSWVERGEETNGTADVYFAEGRNLQRTINAKEEEKKKKTS